MTRFLPRLAFFATLLLLVHAFATSAATETITVTYTPSTPTLTSPLPELSARAYGVFDVATGELLAAYNEAEALPIASVTKLFAAAAILESEALQTTVTVTPSDVLSEGRSGRLSAGEAYTAYELLFPLLLESSNDSAAALERATAREVITKMNDIAKSAGGHTLSFADASGLSDLNVATVRDLATVTTYLYERVPQVFDITQLSRRVGPYVAWTNNSPLKDTNYLGGKHGYTNAANRTAVALYAETLQPGVEKTLGYVLLGSSDLAADIKLLRDYTATAVTFE